MSVPSAVFLDTSIFDGQQYNLESTALATFVPACRKRGLKFLLPKPTEFEVTRHMAEKSQEALNALDGLRKKASFLSKWEGFPERIPPSVAQWQVRSAARDAWLMFLSQFDVVRLGYAGVNLDEVMRWHEQLLPPFSPKKPKEFPDAFALAILELHAQHEDIYVAVVSGDEDIKHACQRFPRLLHFQTLPSLTEALLADVDSRVEELKRAIEAYRETLSELVRDQTNLLDVDHNEGYVDIIDRSGSYVDLEDVSIVAMGDKECTVTFEGELEEEYLLKWDRWRPFRDDLPEAGTSWVTETTPVSGTAKLRFSAGLDNPELSHVELDDDSITLHSLPRHSW